MQKYVKTHVNRVDLVKGFKASILIYLQTSASIQPKMSRSKFVDTYSLPPASPHGSSGAISATQVSLVFTTNIQAVSRARRGRSTG